MDNKQKQTQKRIKKAFKFPEDRSPAIIVVDRIAKVIAVLLAFLLLINCHSLFGGGGYDDEVVVPLFGFADSRIEDSAMKPEIEDRSIVFVRVAISYKEGDVVQYYYDDLNNVARVKSVIKEDVDGKEVTKYELMGDSEKISRTVEGSDIIGKFLFATHAFYDFLEWYHTALGAVTTGIVSLFFLSFGDILMIKKRKKALAIKKEELKKKAERKKRYDEYKEEQREAGNLRKTNAQVVKDGVKEEEFEVMLDEAVLEKEKKKEEKFEQELKEIDQDMKALQDKMKKEEEEFRKNKEKKGK